MSTLTDRYVHAATRFVQNENERTELGMELRERITDTIDGLTERGSDPGSAERDALVQLGDPLKLSAEYRQRPMYLIGPRFFYTWWRVLIIAIATSTPIVAVIVALGTLSSGGGVGEVIGGAIGAAFSVAVQCGFWVTLTFVVIERFAPQVSESTWTPEMLPQLPNDSERGRRADLIASVVMLAITIALMVWQQLASPFLSEGARVPILDPALWVPWLALVVALLVAEIGHAIWVYRSGWTWPVAVVNAVIAVAFAAVVLPLLMQERLVNPELIELLGWSEATGIGYQIGVVTVAVITVWDVVAGFVRAARGRRA